MTHVECLILFQEIFRVKNEIDDWFPNGKNSVRIRLKEKSMLPFMIGKGEDLIFTAESRNEWRLETMESWIKNQTLIIKEKEKRS